MKEFYVETASSLEALLSSLSKKSIDGWEPAWPTYEKDVSIPESARYSVIIQKERPVRTEVEEFGKMRFKHDQKQEK